MRFSKKNVVITAIGLSAIILTAGTVMAADVTDNTRKAVQISANKQYTQTFEKVNDQDAFYFISGGGEYTVEVEDLSGRTDEEIGLMNGIQVCYGEYEVFSAAAGDSPSEMVGATITSYLSPKYSDMKTSLGSHKKGKKVSVVFIGPYKGEYKFKLVGNATPSSGSTSGKTSVKATMQASTTTVAVGTKTTVNISTNGGKITVKGKSKNAKIKKYVKISGSKVVFQKKAPKGTYKFTVTSAAKGNYKKTTKTITIRVK